MSKQFIKISSASNEDGNDLFNAICKDVLHKKSNDVRMELGLPPAEKVTTKDVVTLIQEYKLDCEIIVKFDPSKKKEESTTSDDPFA